MSVSTPIKNCATFWKTKHFNQLSVFELQAIHRIRQTVFVLEQQCAFVDADELDEISHHFTLNAQGHRLPIAYARLVPPNAQYAVPSIGRVLTTAPARGLGWGRELMQFAITQCAHLFPNLGMRLSAQTRLLQFYTNLGFVALGQPYLEDSIEHIEMQRSSIQMTH
jgi:ElaA protein